MTFSMLPHTAASFEGSDVGAPRHRFPVWQTLFIALALANVASVVAMLLAE